ncbi:hypothetical protein ACHAWF_004742 [Thalassiosira exigua]
MLLPPTCAAPSPLPSHSLPPPPTCLTRTALALICWHPNPRSSFSIQGPRQSEMIPCLVSRRASTIARERSLGFSGAGFLGCYHVGVAACLQRHGWLPSPDHDTRGSKEMPLLTGVSAGSMIAAATLAGVKPDPDGMEVVLTAARRTRELSSPQMQQRQKQTYDSKPSTPLGNFPISLDVLTPGFSLIDQVEGPFREAMVKALGGYCSMDDSNNVTIHDIDPVLFSRRFPEGTLRIGLTDRRELWPPSTQLVKAYRYVDTYRNLEDVVACAMLSSYIPGLTGPLKLKDKVPKYLEGLLDTTVNEKRRNHLGPSIGLDASDRAGIRLKELAHLGFVKHGKTGLPLVEEADQSEGTEKDSTNSGGATNYWDGGIADMFPTFDSSTVVVSPLNGVFAPNPAISPQFPGEKTDTTNLGECDDGSGTLNQQQRDSESTTLFDALIRPHLPTTFRHCHKCEMGLNSQNTRAAIKMAFSSSDDDLYSRFRDGYDDAR